MINIKLPDGAIKQVPVGISGLEFAEQISKSLAKKSIAMVVDGKDLDIYLPLTQDCELSIITTDSPKGLEIIRHDTAHLIADAVKALYPDVQVTIGPVIDNGFYYDFVREIPFSTQDLENIEKKMREISAAKIPFRREVWQRSKAIEFFKSIGEDFKAEIIRDIPGTEEISLYRQGEFIDLCRGPHAPDTSFSKYFKLLKVSSAYWRGDSNNQSLQRIYGTAWSTQKELDEYLHMLEEAEKRDHRRIGKELDLFHTSEEAVGSVFWHPKGYKIYNIIQKYIENKLEKHGYVEVKTPLLMNQKLWEKSGHWEKYRDNMFVVEDDKGFMALKPMSCPAHIEIFKQGLKSYRDLPIRMAEFGCCHRNESSGSLHGIMRVRNFTQDDAHIFCTEEQVQTEVTNFCKLLMEVYTEFGFKDVEIKFSTRPEKRAGSNEVWDRAEHALSTAVKNAGYKFDILEGEGAFYGPKLEFHLKDAIGRKWQCGTLQLDFVLPERLGATYIAEDGSKKIPVVLHRAIIGTFERFIGILLENYIGKLPIWLAPVQAIVCPITNAQDGYATKVFEELKSHGIRIEQDLDSQKIGYKIRQHSLQKIPFIVIVGQKEEHDGTVSVRILDGGEDVKVYTIAEFARLCQNTQS